MVTVVVSIISVAVMAAVVEAAVAVGVVAADAVVAAVVDADSSHTRKITCFEYHFQIF